MKRQLKGRGSFEYETFCHILRKRTGGWQGYVAEMLHASIDVDLLKQVFWLVKLAADFLFLRCPFIVPNLARQLGLTTGQQQDELKGIIQQNCQIREQIIHCFLKYYRNGAGSRIIAEKRRPRTF